MRGSPSSWMAGAADIVRALNADEPLDAVLTRVARHTCELAGTDFCSVMLLDDAGERLVVRAGHALTAGYLHLVNQVRPLMVHPAAREFDLPAAQAVREGRTVLLPDITATDILQPWRSAAVAEGIASILAVPMGTEGAYRGALVGYTRRARRFSAEELALVELMAQYAAVVLKTAELRHAEQRTIRRLSAANEELRRERTRREWAETQDRRLMQLLLDDVGLDGVLDALATALDASVTLEAPDGTPLGRAGVRAHHPPPAVAERSNRLLRDALASVDGQRAAAWVNLPADGGALGAWILPVAVAGELAARLWVIRPAHGDPLDRSAIERFTPLVALELLKRRHDVDTELRLTRDLAVELVSGDVVGNEHSLVSRAQALGYDLTAGHTLLLVAVPGASGPRLAGAVRAGIEAPPAARRAG